MSDAFERYNKYCERFSMYVDKLRQNSKLLYPDKLHELADIRRMDVNVLDKLGVFYIGKMVEMLLPEFIDDVKNFGVISETNDKPIFEERWVFPIKDYCGNVINLVGYKRGAEVRYVYGTGKYYDRSNDFYGAENLKLIYDVGWGVVVEGITDCAALRCAGIWNSLATCGTTKSALKMQQLSRARYGIIFIHDRDAAGDGTRTHWIVPRFLRLDILSGDKDIDAYLHSSDSIEERKLRQENLTMTLGECVQWLKQGRCIGGDISKPAWISATLM